MVYMDENKNFFILKKEFIFSNTVEDFIHIYNDRNKIADSICYFKTFDRIFLATHGNFGEDGQLQKILEENSINHIGHSSKTSEMTFLKLTTLEILWKYNICKKWTSEIYENRNQLKSLLEKNKRLCVKPNNGGSSIGVKICSTLEECENHIQELKLRNYEPLLEEVHEGVEFSICLINGKALEPTEIIHNGIFTYEKKYFPNEEVVYKNPASFSSIVNKQIQEDSKKIYEIFQCKSFLRVDGFYNKKNNSIIYTDLNTIPGFQINGLFFKNQNHFNLIEEIWQLPKRNKNKKSKNIFVIFGGDSSEKNVSILSGNNAIFNLNKFSEYNVIGAILYKNKFYILEYEKCFQTSILDFKFILSSKKGLNIKDFIQQVKNLNGVIFNGLHGGIGENGTLQKHFQKANVKYTGSDEKISKLAMNKYKTRLFLCSLKNKFIEKHLYIPEEYFIKNFKDYDFKKFQSFFSKPFCIKPNDDGCSVGVNIIRSFPQLINYQKAVKNKQSEFENLPLSLQSKDYLLQEYIETDEIKSEKSRVIKIEKTGWFEGTISTLGKKVLIPSVSISNNNFLTMKEKFLQGVGTNLTPIPFAVADNNDIKIIRKLIKKIVINNLKIDTYCRVDYFYNVNTKKMIILEINTLPALTPSTVLFSQAIYYNLTPKLLFQKILKLA
jgi:D-alanine--D-alanine ligase